MAALFVSPQVEMDSSKEEGLRTQPPPIAGASTYKVSFRACLTVIGGFFALFCGVGFTNAFGIFQEYYMTDILPEYSASAISWIGSVSIFLTYILAPVTGVVVDRYGPTVSFRHPIPDAHGEPFANSAKPLIVAGSVLELFSIFMVSLCKEYYQFFLAQAIVFGVATCLLTLPPISAVSRAMPSHRGLVIGIVVGGSSIGGIIWPIMLERLFSNQSLSFGWVMRIVGFTMLPLLVFASATIRDHPKRNQKTVLPASESSESDTPSSSPNPNRAASQWRSSILSILKSPVFLLLSIGLAISYLGMFLPFFYIVSYATSSIPSLPKDIPFYLASIVNAASLFGRTLPGYLADRYFGHFNLLFAAVFLSGMIGFTWTAADTLAGIVVWCLAYGFTSGAILSLQSACAGKIVGLEKQGLGVGLVMGAVSVGSLAGAPIGGSLVGSYGYLGLSMFTGATLVAGSLFVGAARLGLDKKMFAAV